MPVHSRKIRKIRGIQMNVVSVTGAGPANAPDDPRIRALRDAAVELEASFLAEMLKSAGLAKTSDSFGGGAGEDQFSSFLVRAQAEQIAKSGGIGLAEMFFHALSEAPENAD
jgi:Rod binding domain-containing protein